MPQRPGDYGIETRQRHDLAGARAAEADETIKRERSAIEEEEICTCSA